VHRAENFTHGAGQGSAGGTTTNVDVTSLDSGVLLRMTSTANDPSRADIVVSMIGPDVRILELDVTFAGKTKIIAKPVGYDADIMYYQGSLTIVDDACDLDQASRLAIEWISAHSILLRDIDAYKTFEVCVSMGRNDGSRFFSFSDELLTMLVDHGFDLKIQCFQEPQSHTDISAD